MSDSSSSPRTYVIDSCEDDEVESAPSDITLESCSTTVLWGSSPSIDEEVGTYARAYKGKRLGLKSHIRFLRDKATKDRTFFNDLDDPYRTTNEQLVKNGSTDTLYGYLPNEKHKSPFDSHHPEKPDRCKSIHRKIESIYHRLSDVSSMDPHKLDVKELLKYAHSDEYISELEGACLESTPERFKDYDSLYGNGLMSFTGATETVQMVVDMATFVAEGWVKNCFVNARPPGHHATASVPNGYCFFNNVAIAAKHILGKKLAQKILIIDFDIHHGQGTQEFFYKSKEVLYFSIHRFEDGMFWPNLKESDYTFIGESKSAPGYNVNVPLNETGMTDFDYLSIVMNLLLPMAYEYNPDLILVSAGYDSCFGCPEGKMNVTPAFYGHLIHLIGGLANGKIAVVLEGGYYLPTLAEGALQTVRALLGDVPPRLEYHRRLNSSVIDTINNVKCFHVSIWKCFRDVDLVETESDLLQYDRYAHHVPKRRYFGVQDSSPFPLVDCYPTNSESLSRIFISKLEYLKESYPNAKAVIGYNDNIKYSMEHKPKETSKLHQRALDVPKRTEHMKTSLETFNLLKSMTEIPYNVDKNELTERLKHIHSPEYIDKLIDGGVHQEPDLYWIEGATFESCISAVGAICEILTSIKKEKITSGVSVVRPPGHHAKRDKANGFCLVNNVVVSADWAIRTLGYNKILILDFDVHHGDGTQSLTYNRDDIMYMSLHRYDAAKYFPKDEAGHWSRIGNGKCTGYNINISFEGERFEGESLKEKDKVETLTDIDYLMPWLKIIVPVAYNYNPDIIIVSAGFDAAINDPLGHYRLSPEIFGHFIQTIKAIAPIALVLEGGYHFESTSLAMVNCVRALLGHTIPRLKKFEPVTTSSRNVMNKIIPLLKPYWPILEVNKSLDNQMVDEVHMRTDHCLFFNPKY